MSSRLSYNEDIGDSTQVFLRIVLFFRIK